MWPASASETKAKRGGAPRGPGRARDRSRRGWDEMGWAVSVPVAHDDSIKSRGGLVDPKV